MDITHPEALSAINSDQAHKVDKLYRMWGGLSSHLLSYQDGIITLQIHHTDRWLKSPTVTAKQLAECWRKYQPALRDAHSYQVYVHHSGRETGFVTPTKGKDKKQLAEELLQGIQRMHRAQREERVGQLIKGAF